MTENERNGMTESQPGPARQHGAMEYSEPATDLDAVRRYRLQRVREQLARLDCAGIVLYDPLNLRYATDVTNMQVWTMHNENRYAFIAADGPSILFEYYGCAHLARDVPTVDEIRPPQAWYYMNVGPRGGEIARRLEQIGNPKRSVYDYAREN